MPNPISVVEKIQATLYLFLATLWFCINFKAREWRGEGDRLNTTRYNTELIYNINLDIYVYLNLFVILILSYTTIIIIIIIIIFFCCTIYISLEKYTGCWRTEVVLIALISRWYCRLHWLYADPPPNPTVLKYLYFILSRPMLMILLFKFLFV